MKKLIVIAGIATALALTSSANAGVNLVVNGDFANPSLSAGQWIAGASGAYGWYNDNKSDWVEIGKSSVYGLSAAPGNSLGQNLEVSGNASPATVYQTISGLKIGQVYNVSWLYGGRVGSTGTDTYTVVTFGGTVLGPNETGSSGIWTPYSFDIAATATSEKLAFTGYTPFCNGTCGNEITNVSVAGVPEPSTWAMMLAGFGALAFAGYRRKGAVAA